VEIVLEQGGPLEAVQKHLQTLKTVEDVNYLEAKIEQLLIAVRLKKVRPTPSLKVTPPQLLTLAVLGRTYYKNKNKTKKMDSVLCV